MTFLHDDADSLPAWNLDIPTPLQLSGYLAEKEVFGKLGIPFEVDPVKDQCISNFRRSLDE